MSQQPSQLPFVSQSPAVGPEQADSSTGITNIASKFTDALHSQRHRDVVNTLGVIISEVRDWQVAARQASSHQPDLSAHLNHLDTGIGTLLAYIANAPMAIEQHETVTVKLDILAQAAREDSEQVDARLKRLEASVGTILENQNTIVVLLQTLAKPQAATGPCQQGPPAAALPLPPPAPGLNAPQIPTALRPSPLTTPAASACPELFPLEYTPTPVRTPNTEVIVASMARGRGRKRAAGARGADMSGRKPTSVAKKTVPVPRTVTRSQSSPLRGQAQLASSAALERVLGPPPGDTDAGLGSCSAFFESQGFALKKSEGKGNGGALTALVINNGTVAPTNGDDADIDLAEYLRAKRQRELYRNHR